VIGSYAGAILIVVGFTWLLIRLRLVEQSRQINTIVRQSAATTADRSLSDSAKAEALRRYSLTLFGLFASLTLGLVVAVGLPILLVWLIALTELWSFEGALEATLSWPLIIAGILPLLYIFLRSERRRES
jgi:hypothetical protein